MYDELVEALRLCVRYGKGADVLANALNAADAIEDLENKLNLWRQGKISRWVSVAERLPKDGSDVLAYLKTADESRITAANYYKETWQDCVMGPLYLTEEGFVTHWMPLPEPPREEE